MITMNPDWCPKISRHDIAISPIKCVIITMVIVTFITIIMKMITSTIQVQGFVIEFVISLILVLVVFGAAADEEAMSTSFSCYGFIIVIIIIIIIIIMMIIIIQLLESPIPPPL